MKSVKCGKCGESFDEGKDQAKSRVPMPNGAWMTQVARNLTMAEGGFLTPDQHVIHDRDTKFCSTFQVPYTLWVAPSFASAGAASAGPEPIKIAIHRVSSLFSKAIIKIIVKGTERIMPTGPNTHPQNTIERKTVSVEIPRLFPISLGSRTLPKTTLITTYPNATTSARVRPNWIKARTTAGAAVHSASFVRQHPTWPM